uniref:Uncharacterized protein n=1 Tax=Micrurus corallinus TaxID=54390 RepID=A0A2D4ERX2_MICCO
MRQIVYKMRVNPSTLLLPSLVMKRVQENKLREHQESQLTWKIKLKYRLGNISSHIVTLYTLLTLGESQSSRRNDKDRHGLQAKCNLQQMSKVQDSVILLSFYLICKPSSSD